MATLSFAVEINNPLVESFRVELQGSRKYHEIEQATEKDQIEEIEEMYFLLVQFIC